MGARIGGDQKERRLWHEPRDYVNYVNYVDYVNNNVGRHDTDRRARISLKYG